MNTRVVNLNSTDGQSYDIYGGRPQWLGNRYLIGRDGTRKEVIAKYITDHKEDAAFLARVRQECAGKVLGCFCKPLLCHLDWVAHVADGHDLLDANGQCTVLIEHLQAVCMRHRYRAQAIHEVKQGIVAPDGNIYDLSSSLLAMPEFDRLIPRRQR